MIRFSTQLFYILRWLLPVPYIREIALIAPYQGTSWNITLSWRYRDLPWHDAEATLKL